MTFTRFHAALTILAVLGSASAAFAQTALSAAVGQGVYLHAASGDLLKVRIDQLAPTQPAIGYDQVYYKLQRYRYDAKQKFDDYCEDNGQRGVQQFDERHSRLADPSSFTCKKAEPKAGDAAARELKTVVVGPAGQLYLTDGHHATTILREVADGGPALRLLVRVTDNFSNLATAAFWTRMAKENKAWLKDTEDQTIAPAQLPKQVGLGRLKDNPYRSLVYFTRGIGYEPPAEATEFLEFYWGSWLRQRAGLDLSRYDLDDADSYRQAVGDAARKMVALDNNAEVWQGKTAAQLGRLKRFDPDGDLKKLARHGSSGKEAGRLVYAVDYRKSLKHACRTDCR